MRPHMAHIQNTLIKKKLAEDASNQETSYKKYMKLVTKARNLGHSVYEIISELENEKNVIEKMNHDNHEGDPIFQQGVRNAKTSCINAINIIIEELKGENT